MIEQALLIWGLDPSVYQPEIARTTFLQGRLLTILGKDEQACKLIEKATAFWSTTDGSSSAGEKGSQPSPEDFDNLVAFWSR